MIKKILVPLDGSKQSDKTLDYAFELARNLETGLVVMHVIDDTFTENIEKTMKDVLSGVKIKDAIDAYANIFTKEIFDSASEKAVTYGVRLKTYSVRGDPAEEILKYAKKKKVDLIVMGSTGIGKAEQFLFGSVTDKVARHAPCTVTIVR